MRNQNQHRKTNPILWITGLCVLTYIMIPVIIIVLMSFSSSRYLEFPPPGWSLKWYDSLFADPKWLESFAISVEIAFAVTVLTTILGLGASIGMSKIRPRIRNVLSIAFLTPMIVPVIVVAVASYFFYANLGLLETRVSLILAHTTLALPLFILNVTSVMRGVEESLELAARSLGATPFRAFFSTTFPLIRPGVMVGALFAFITSFDEPVVAIFIAGTRAVTLPKRMWDGVRYEIDPTVASVATLIIVFTTAMVVVTQVLRSRTSTRQVTHEQML